MRHRKRDIKRYVGIIEDELTSKIYEENCAKNEKDRERGKRETKEEKKKQRERKRLLERKRKKGREMESQQETEKERQKEKERDRKFKDVMFKAHVLSHLNQKKTKLKRRHMSISFKRNLLKNNFL